MRNGLCSRNFLHHSPLLLLICILAALSACEARTPEIRATTLTEDIITPIGCGSPSAIRDQLWNSLYREAATYSNLPKMSALKKSLRASGQPSAVAESYEGLYSEILTALVDIPDSQQLLKRLAELELGDRTTPEKSAEQDRIEAHFKLLERADREKGIRIAGKTACPGPAPAPAPVDLAADDVPLFEEFRQNYTPAIYGAYKIFSVGYQSCTAMDPAPLTFATRPVEGIEVVGTHPAGGKQRVVASASDVLKTNPYYFMGRVTPSGSCLPEQENPLIYDFGGKPYVNSNTAMEFDLFQNGGSGMTALGIDCSGLVSGALLVSGLKLKKTASAKAYQVNGVSSSMLLDPAANGLSCLNRRSTIHPEDKLLAGDIIVQSGHVVMVDQVGVDPFGLSGITNSADCTTSKMSASRFNFSIIQSSSSLGGIGMNRFSASSYLSGNSTMRNGLIEYAAAYCKSKFGAQATVPSTATAVVVRHSGTPECSDRRVAVKYSNCMKDCARRGTRSLASKYP